MCEHPLHLSGGNEISHVGKKSTQTKIFVIEQNAVKRYFKPKAADPLPLAGNLDKKRRYLAPVKFS